MSVDQVVIELLIECSLLPLVHIMPSFLFIVTTSLQAFSKKILVFLDTWSCEQYCKLHNIHIASPLCTSQIEA